MAKTDIELGKLTEQISREALKPFPENEPLSPDTAAQALRAVLSQLEEAMAAICRQYGKYLLLRLFRGHISPRTMIAGSNTPSLNLKAIQVATLAILKYGRNDVEARFRMLPRGAVIPFGSSEWADAVKLFELSFFYNDMMKYWKALGGGAELTVTNGYIVWLNRDLNSQRIADFENLRLKKTTNLLSPVASNLFVNDEVAPPGAVLGVYVALALYRPGEIYDGKPAMMEFPTVEGKRQFAVQYLPHWLDLHAYLDMSRVYSRLVVDEFGIDPDGILAGLVSLANMTSELIAIEPYAQEDFLLTGTVHFPKEIIRNSLATQISRWSPWFSLKQTSSEVAERFMRKIPLTPARCGTLDLHNGWIPSLVYDLGDRFVLDWTTVPFFLNTIIYGASQKAEMKEFKGKRLEQDLRAWILDQCSGLAEYFPQNQKLKKAGQVYGEVDLALSKGPVGFLVDAKAYNVSLGCLRGDRDAVNTRWGYTEEWLSQVRDTARILAATPVGDNYSLPESITHVVPVVCSPYVEPLYEFDDRHMITDECPRVCTPVELIELLSADFGTALLTNEYTYSVARS